MSLPHLQRMIIALGILCASSTSWSATDLSPDVMNIANQWAAITYSGNDQNREDALSKLYSRTNKLLEASPDNENLLTWSGIVTASYAGEVGGLKALKIVKKAKRQFEKAMELNPDALNGGARTSLGALYYQVPGWPIGFGNKKKAEKLLTESADRFPNDINTLFFLADFLIDSNRPREAKPVLEKAAKLAPRDAYRVADTGRLNDVKKLFQNYK